METKAISTDQLQLMQHCIGYTIKRVKRGKYVAFRNRYIASRPNNLWEEICECGYADGEHFNYGGSIFSMVYKVTRKGMDFMEGILGVKIEEAE